MLTVRSCRRSHSSSRSILRDQVQRRYVLFALFLSLSRCATEALPEICTESLGLTFQLQGVKADDQILSFGSVVYENHDGLKALAGQVRKGERVEVELLRQGSRVRVGLVPRDGWGGRGLIGYVLLRPSL